MVQAPESRSEQEQISVEEEKVLSADCRLNNPPRLCAPAHSLLAAGVFSKAAMNVGQRCQSPGGPGPRRERERKSVPSSAWLRPWG